MKIKRGEKIQIIVERVRGEDAPDDVRPPEIEPHGLLLRSNLRLFDSRRSARRREPDDGVIEPPPIPPPPVIVPVFFSRIGNPSLAFVNLPEFGGVAVSGYLVIQFIDLAVNSPTGNLPNLRKVRTTSVNLQGTQTVREDILTAGVGYTDAQLQVRQLAGNYNLNTVQVEIADSFDGVTFSPFASVDLYFLVSFSGDTGSFRVPYSTILSLVDSQNYSHGAWTFAPGSGSTGVDAYTNGGG